jgi:hypothetical protein
MANKIFLFCVLPSFQMDGEPFMFVCCPVLAVHAHVALCESFMLLYIALFEQFMSMLPCVSRSCRPV